MKYIRKILQAIALVVLLTSSVSAQGPIYLPVILKGGSMAVDPILRISGDLDGERITIDLLGPHSGFKLEDPNWSPAIAQPKGGGSYVSSRLAPGRTLTDAEDDNVVETIPLSVRGTDQDLAIQTLRKLLQLIRQGRSYWTRDWETEDVWLEARPACNDCFTGYSRLIQVRISNIGNVFGQPFFTALNSEAVIDGVTLIAEREPYWRPLPPGEIVGPLYNLPRNPDFELWNFGTADSQPDNWDNLESVGITGTNNREDTFVQYGEHALRIEVRQSTGINQVKGVTQVADGTRDGETYTMLAWIKSDGVGNGVGRLLITTNIGTFEVYRDNTRHGWTLYTQVFTIGTDDVVGVNCEILTTDANTDGTVYFDGLMLVEGDWQQEAIDGVLPWMSSSHIVNHWDQPEGPVIDAGDINWVDAWNVPGDVSAPVRLEFRNNQSPADEEDPIERYNTIRVGLRRTRDVTKFDNYEDPSATLDATASSGARLDSQALTNEWSGIVTNIITDADNVLNNQGRFRAFARLLDPTQGEVNLTARLVYFTGVAGTGEKALDSVIVPINQNWCIVNLTENTAINRDFKFWSQPPGQMGYRIEFSRPTGTDEGQFDYSIIMPTDGGYMEATVDPALAFLNTFVIDGIQDGNVFVTTPVVGKVGSFGLANVAFEDMKAFGGEAYAAGENIIGAAFGAVYRRSGANWEISLPDVGNVVQALAVHEGGLYAIKAGGGGADQMDVFRTFDGVGWGSVFTFAQAGTSLALISYNGNLWIGAGKVLPLPVENGAWFWDGAALTHSLNIADAIIAFEIHRGNLYALSNNADLYEYNRDAGTWALIFASGEAAGMSLKSFNGRLFMGTRDNGRIYAWDGSAGVLVRDSTAPERIAALEVHNDELYMAGTKVLDGLPIERSADGDTWEVIYDPSATFIRSMLSLEGVLYLGGDDLSDVEIEWIQTSEAGYSIPDFQGTTFSAPPRRVLTGNTQRHRWVFSYDRDGFINNLDDKGLVGLGYSPRYLTLRGAD